MKIGGSSPLRGCYWKWEGYRGGGVRLGCSVLEGAHYLGKGFDLFAKCIDGRPVVLMDLIDHLYHDHIFFASGGSPNFQVLIYLMKKVQEIGTGRGVLQEYLIDMWEA